MNLVIRVARALAAGNSHPKRALEYAQKKWGANSDEYRALKLWSVEDGGSLHDPVVLYDFAKALRAVSVVRRMGARGVPMRGSTRGVKITSGAMLSYIGENGPIPVTEQRFGNINMTTKKLSAIVPLSGSMMRHSGDQAEAIVQQDLLEGVAATEDAQFIRGDGTQHHPRGMRFWARDESVIPANGTVNLDNVVENLEQLMAAVEDTDVPMRRPGFLMAPRSRRFLATLRDTAGAFVFKDEMAAGTLFGQPFAVTTGVPTNLGGGENESEITYADFSEVVVGDGELWIDVAAGADYEFEGELKTAFEKDQWLIRVIAEHDLTVRHREAVAVLTGVTWGAA